jgi:hypothetical protein
MANRCADFRGTILTDETDDVLVIDYMGKLQLSLAQTKESEAI